MKNFTLKRLLFSTAVVGFTAAGMQAQSITFSKDENRDFTNKMGMGAKSFIPFIADFDGNGLMDVYFGGEAWANGWADGSFVALNNGAGNEPAWNTIADYTGQTIPAFYGGKARVAFDMDQDGDLDAIILDNRGSGWTSAHPNVGYHSYRVIKNVDNGKQFEDITAESDGLGGIQFGSDNNGGNSVHCVEVADVNMDGYPDILLQGETLWGGQKPWERATKLFLNKGGNGFEEVPDQFVGTNSGSILVGDFNGDGYPDVVVSGYTQGDESKGVNGGECFILYKNDGTGHFTLDQNLSSKYGKSGEETVMHVVDYDQDGKLDILIIGSVPQVGLSLADNDKIAFILRNRSTDGNISFEEMATNIYPTSANGSRASFLADFNGDGFVDYLGQGWGINKDWTNGIYASYSTGLDQYTTVNGVVTGDEEGWMGLGDVDGDGLLDFMSPNNGDNNSPMFYRNTTEAQCAVPGAPTNVEYTYDKAAKRLTLTWDKMMTTTGSKAIYNVYIVKDGKTYMRCPAIKETGKQMAYTSFGNYLPAETCFFEGIEPGEYEIGVQSVAYSWNASEFTTIKATTATATIKATAITPEQETEMETATTFTLTFDQSVTLNTAEDAPQVIFMGLKNRVQVPATLSMVEGADNQVLVTLNEEVEDPGMYKLQIPEKIVFNADGDWNEAAEWSYIVTGKKVETETYVPVSIDPAAGSAYTSLKEFTLTFKEGTCAVKNADIEGADAYLLNKADDSRIEAELLPLLTFNTIAIILKEKVTTAGTYTLVIPARNIQQGADEWGNSILDNAPELTYDFTVDPTVGVAGILADDAKVDVYTVDGAVVLKDADRAALNTLKKGIYVINGKKVVVK